MSTSSSTRMTCLSSEKAVNAVSAACRWRPSSRVAALAELQDGEVLAAAGGMAVDVGEHAGHGVLDEPQDAGLGRDARPGSRAPRRGRRASGRSVAPRCVTAVTRITGTARLGEAQVAGELGHGLARVRSARPRARARRQDLALDDDLGARDGLGRRRSRSRRARRAGRAGRRRRSARRSRGAWSAARRRREVDGRVEAHADRDRQGPARSLGLRAELVDVPGRAVKLTVRRSGPMHAHAVDGDVGLAGLGVLGAQQRHVEVGTRVTARARGRRQQAAQVERRPQDDLLAWRRPAGDHDGRHRPLERGAAGRRPAGRASCRAAAPCAAGWRARRPRPPCRSR